MARAGTSDVGKENCEQNELNQWETRDLIRRATSAGRTREAQGPIGVRRFPDAGPPCLALAQMYHHAFQLCDWSHTGIIWRVRTHQDKMHALNRVYAPQCLSQQQLGPGQQMAANGSEEVQTVRLSSCDAMSRLRPSKTHDDVSTSDCSERVATRCRSFLHTFDWLELQGWFSFLFEHSIGCYG